MVAFGFRFRFQIRLLLVFAVLVCTTPTRADEAAFIGMQIQGVSEGVAQAIGLDHAHGVLIRDVALGGPAAAAGFQRGDLIVTFAGKPVETFDGLVAVVKGLKAGAAVEAEVQRRGLSVRLTLTTGGWPEAWRITRGGFANLPDVGLTVAAITEKVRGTFDLRWGTVGLVVSMVDQGKPASRAVRRGDVILQVNQVDVWKPDQFMAAVQQAKRQKRDSLLLLVEGAEGFRFTLLSLK